jgi:hypothetical protein
MIMRQYAIIGMSVVIIFAGLHRITKADAKVLLGASMNKELTVPEVAKILGIENVQQSPIFISSCSSEVVGGSSSRFSDKLSLNVKFSSFEPTRSYSKQIAFSKQEWRAFNQETETIITISILSFPSFSDAYAITLGQTTASSMPNTMAVSGYVRSDDYGDICVVSKPRQNDKRGVVYFCRGNLAIFVRGMQNAPTKTVKQIANEIDSCLKKERSVPSSANSLAMKLSDDSSKMIPNGGESRNIVKVGEISLLTLADGEAIPAANQEAGDNVTVASVSAASSKASDKKEKKTSTTPPVSPTEVQIRATHADISLGKDGKHRIKFLKPGKQTVKVFYLDKTGKVYAAGELKVTVQPDPNAPRRLRKRSRRPAQVKPSEK